MVPRRILRWGLTRTPRCGAGSAEEAGVPWPAVAPSSAGRAAWFPQAGGDGPVRAESPGSRGCSTTSTRWSPTA